MLPSIDDIAKKRKILGLTQKQLAELAGVSQSLIAKIESGKIEPSYKKVKAIFDALAQVETKVNFHVGEILHNEVVGIQKKSPVSEAVQLMMKYGYSQLPVFDGEHPVGSISEKTILSQVLEGRDLSHISTLIVEDIMDEAFPQVGENAPLPLVSSLLQVYPAVLVSKKGKVIGIVTKADLLKMLLTA
ncbi:MAG: CBS domain-containing protein [Candidatus Bathyarchaeia archaeon]